MGVLVGDDLESHGVTPPFTTPDRSPDIVHDPIFEAPLPRVRGIVGFIQRREDSYHAGGPTVRMVPDDCSRPVRSVVDRFGGEDRAVSNVVGTSLLVGITVVLAAVFGAFVLALVLRSLFFVVGGAW